MKISKSTIQVYYLRGEYGYWADISLDIGENSGRCSIASDWGSWSNYWGACGSSFKDFLTHLDIHYFAGKVGESHWLDVDATILEWKREVLEYRRRDEITAEFARDIYDEIKELEDCDSALLVAESYHKDALMKFNDYCPSTVTGVSPRFRNFWDKAWNPFVEELKLEALQEVAIAA